MISAFKEISIQDGGGSNTAVISAAFDPTGQVLAVGILAKAQTTKLLCLGDIIIVTIY